MKKPVAPPKLAKLTARLASFEAAREAFFPLWKLTLEKCEGNIARAGREMFADDALMNAEDAVKENHKARDQAQWATRRLGLVEYAAELRLKAQGHAMGRPPKKSKKRLDSK